jgi:predicted nucleotidyltransferase
LKLLNAINEFGFDTSGLNQITAYETKGFIRLPLDNFYIEIMAIIDGKMRFDDAYERAYNLDLEGVNLKVIGYDDLIQNKIMTRRPKDLEDITQLERIKKLQNKKN